MYNGFFLRAQSAVSAIVKDTLNSGKVAIIDCTFLSAMTTMPQKCWCLFKETSVATARPC